MKFRNLLVFWKYSVQKHPIRLFFITLISTIILVVVSLCWFTFFDGYLSVEKNLLKDFAQYGDKISFDIGENYTPKNKEKVSNLLNQVYPVGYSYNYKTDNSISVLKFAGFNLADFDFYEKFYVAEQLDSTKILQGAQFSDTAENKVWISSFIMKMLLKDLQYSINVNDKIPITLERQDGFAIECEYELAGIINGRENYISVSNALELGFHVNFPTVIVQPQKVNMDTVKGLTLNSTLSKVYPHAKILYNDYENILKVYSRTTLLQLLLTIIITILLIVTIAFTLSNSTMISTYDSGTLFSICRLLGLRRKDLYHILLLDSFLSSCIALCVSFCAAIFFGKISSYLVISFWSTPLAMLNNHSVITNYYWFVPLASFVIFYIITILSTYVFYKKFANNLVLKTLKEGTV